VHPAAPSGHRPGSSRIVAIIPARYQSSRLPGKPLAELGGRPMIEHVYRRAQAAPSVDAVVVATDDDRIRQAVEAFGGTARMTRLEHATGSDRLAEVAADLACDVVVNVQGDEPLIDPLMIEEAIAPLVADPALQMSTLCRPIDDPRDYLDPNVVKVVRDQDGFALYFSRAPIPYVRAGGEDGAGGARALDGAGVARQHIGLYVYRRECLLAFARLPPTALERAEGLEQLRALEHGVRIRTVETARESVGVDTPEDLERARRLLAAGAVR
jgi:3-deoxy-manno-octulosonate cytidylyltransferase (CMP-KDO synthetase)